MATNYPTSLDSFTNPSAGSALNSPSHAGQHADINDAMEAVQAKLGVGAGTIGTWTSYTPTLTNFTASYLDCKYAQINNVMFVSLSITISGMTGIPVVTMPTNFESWSMNSNVWLIDAGSGELVAETAQWSPNQIFFRNYQVSGALVYPANVTNTAPFTWVSGDIIRAGITVKV